MNRQEVHHTLQCARINRKQYRSLNPVRFFGAIISVLVSGSSVVTHRGKRPHRHR